jgi:hypothetical protein
VLWRVGVRFELGAGREVEELAVRGLCLVLREDTEREETAEGSDDR